MQEGLPTKSEMSDATAATQAEWVMLNEGPNLGAGVAAMDPLYRGMGENQSKTTPTLRALRSWLVPGALIPEIPAPGMGTTASVVE